MPLHRRNPIVASLLSATLALAIGCATTRSTDTARTATEQLLISDAIDRAVQSLDLQPLAGQSIFLDESKVADAVDKNYFVSTLRQQLLANGCELKEKREDADFIVEARAGAIGTDRSDLLFGIQQTPVPAIPVIQPLPSTVPEVPLAKRKDQRGIAKIAIFAYHRASGSPVWQSGIVRVESSANDVWILGAGPFQRGSIYDEDRKNIVKSTLKGEVPKETANALRPVRNMSIAKEALFNAPDKLVNHMPPASSPVVQASHQEPSVASKPASPAPAAQAPAPAAPAGAQTAATSAPKPLATDAAAQPIPKPAPPQSPNPAANAAVPPPAKPPEAPPGSFANAADGTPLPQPRFNSPQ